MSNLKYWQSLSDRQLDIEVAKKVGYRAVHHPVKGWFIICPNEANEESIDNREYYYSSEEYAWQSVRILYYTSSVKYTYQLLDDLGLRSLSIDISDQQVSVGHQDICVCVERTDNYTRDIARAYVLLYLLAKEEKEDHGSG